jgi:NADPH:quinone reductase-like Zn-dependent oxidoreductase
MKAIVLEQFGGPEQLILRDIPQPEPRAGEVVIRVKAFGLNRAETYMRKGVWGKGVPVLGIECVGLVDADPDGRLQPGQKVAALMGGMGRTINGSYAQYTRVPATNVMPIETDLPWEQLAAIPESYATAWRCLHGNLHLQPGQILLVRGATSALGQAALNIAAHAGATVIATTRDLGKTQLLERLGAVCVLKEGPGLSAKLKERHPRGVDAVLDIVGNSSLLDSLAATRADGRVCTAGFLGGADPIAAFDPLSHIPSGVQLSFFASFMFGTPAFPLLEVPLQRMVEHAASGAYRALPAKVFGFEEIQDAHRLMDAHQANGKIVVKL